MKFCTQCGQSALDDHKFCTKCGASFDTTPAAAQPTAAPGVVFTPAPPPGEKAKSNRNVILLVIGAVALVIVMPILIIVAVAYPALVRARSAANESAAVRSVHMLDSALNVYYQKYSHYPIALEQLTELPHVRPDSTHAGIIAEAAVRPRHSGYNFSYQASRSSDNADLDHYELHADPVEPGSSGVHHFFSDESGVIRWDQNAASAGSPKLNY
jgi:hypothetical protein